MRIRAFLLPSLLYLATVPAHGQGVDYSSDAYIKSHFFYGDTARISMVQKEAIPNLPMAKPCSASVMPAAPAQYGKHYFVDAVISFPDTSVVHTEGKKPPKLPAMDKEGVSTAQSMCRLENKHASSPNPKTGTRWCMMARVGRYLVISDSFHDSCGNYFRGFWEAATVMDSYVHGKPQFTSMDEHSITTSLGRFDGMERDPQYASSFNGVPGPTGDVPVNRFLFFQKATEKDLLELNKQIEQQVAPRGPYHRCAKDGSFQLSPSHCPK